MVLLTMTPSIVDGLKKLSTLTSAEPETAADADVRQEVSSDEPSLDSPEVGKPISHGQILDLWRVLQRAKAKGCSLESLLRGACVYVPPPPPKPEPSNEYKALMARLRREEEQRAYERMLNPPPRLETFAERFPHAHAPSSLASQFSEANRPADKRDEGTDAVTLADAHRQVMLILNFVASILGVAATVWVVARWWSTPARVFVTLGSAILVAVAEVAVYGGYVWRLGEAKSKQDKTREVREVVQTWVVGGEGVDEKTDKKEETIAVPLLVQVEEERFPDATAVRRRKGR